MKNYQVTDEEIRQALTDASKGFIGGFHINGNDGLDPDKWETNHVDMMNAFLDALPEPQDEWEQCMFSQVSERDLKVKVVWDDFAMEGEISAVDEGAIYIADRGVVDIGGDWKKIYRIPAPVQHPDPAEHPVILVHEAYGEPMVPPIGMIWDASEHYESPSHRIEPDQITGFTPAKVVPSE